MTTTVSIAVSGNKQVLVTCGANKTLLQPGAHANFLMHGDTKIAAEEFGEFVNEPSLPLVLRVPDNSNQGDLIKGVSAAADNG